LQKEKYDNYTENEDGEKLSWIDMAKNKWEEFTSSHNETSKNDPDEYSFYNNTYFDKFEDSLPKEKWEKYLKFRDYKPKEDEPSFWNKTMTLFGEGKDKLANLTNFDENKEKVIDWERNYLRKE